MNRRAYLAGVGAVLTPLGSGCQSLGGFSPSAADSTPECPTTVPKFVNADFDGEVQIICNDRGSESATDETTLVADPQTTSMPSAEVEFRLTNRRDHYYSTNPFEWFVRKYVDEEWRLAVPSEAPATEHSSLAPGESWSWTLTSEGSTAESDIPTDPVRSDDTIAAPLPGAGAYAFQVYGSYGEQGHHKLGNTPIVSYAVRFTVEAE